MIRRVLAALVPLAAALTLASCTSTVSGLEPARHANDPACAEVTVRLPATIGDQARRWTDAQATGAWGTPAAVILTCGLEPPAPSTLPCETVAGVDWLIDDSDAPNYRFTTFGRDPAVEVFVDYDDIGGREALDALGIAVGTLPPTGQACTERSVG